MEIANSLVMLIVSIVLTSESSRITNFLLDKKPKIVPSVKLLLAFISIGFLIASIPAILIEYEIDMYVFFIPFGYMLFRFTQLFRKELREIKEKSLRRSFVTNYLQMCMVFGWAGTYIFLMAPFVNMI